MTTATLRRTTIVNDAAEFEKRKAGLVQRMLPYLQQQPGFEAHELTLDDAAGNMTEVTHWASADDARRYIRGGAAAMCATWLDGYLPTAPYPNGNWTRTIE
jgi:heme-degrading monooxygenase HmoA